MKLIIGLGNPGKEYVNTRHNVGFLILDNLLENIKWSNMFNALYYETIMNGEKVLFIKPQTYMNLSGDSVIKFVNYFKVNSEDILVIHDDLDLSKFKFRVKFDSSSGGHNGVKSIINNLGTQKFTQLKIGISNTDTDTKNYVLDNLSKEELLFLQDSTFKNIINDFVLYNFNYLSNKYNKNGE